MENINEKIISSFQYNFLFIEKTIYKLYSPKIKMN